MRFYLFVVHNLSNKSLSFNCVRVLCRKNCLDWVTHFRESQSDLHLCLCSIAKVETGLFYSHVLMNFNCYTNKMLVFHLLSAWLLKFWLLCTISWGRLFGVILQTQMVNLCPWKYGTNESQGYKAKLRNFITHLTNSVA